MFQLERQRGDVSPAGEGGLRRLPSPTCCRGRPPTLFPSLCSPPPPPSLPAGLSSHLRVPQRFRIPLPWPVQPHEQRRLGQQLPQRGVRHQHLQVGPHPPALVPPTRGEKAGGTLQFTVIPAGGASWAPSSGEDAEQSKVPGGFRQSGASPTRETRERQACLHSCCFPLRPVLFSQVLPYDVHGRPCVFAQLPQKQSPRQGWGALEDAYLFPKEDVEEEAMRGRLGQGGSLARAWPQPDPGGVLGTIEAQTWSHLGVLDFCILSAEDQVVPRQDPRRGVWFCLVDSQRGTSIDPHRFLGGS